MSSIPGLLEDMDQLASSSTAIDSGKVLRTLQRSLDLEERMQSWYAGLQSSANNVALFWREARTQTTQDREQDPDLQYLFPYRLNFSSLRLAQLHQIFWAATMEIYSAMEELLLIHERIRQLSPDSASQSLSASPIVMELSRNRSITQISALATYYADLCCESQQYLCSADMGAVGPQSTLAALGMVKMFYQTHDARKFRWARRELEKLVLRGFGAAKLLSSLDKEGYANLGKRPAWVSEPEGETLRNDNIISGPKTYVTMPIRTQEEQPK